MIKFSLSNLVQSVPYMLDFESGQLRKMLRAMRSWGKQSEIDDVGLPDIILGDIAFENILSIRALELALTLVGWSVFGRNRREYRESRNLFADVSWS